MPRAPRGASLRAASWRGRHVQIRVGYELKYTFPQPTPLILTLSIHYTRVSDIVRADHMIVRPSVPMSAYRDGFGNWCTRLVAPAGQVPPAGQVQISADAVVNDSGQ